MCQDAIYYTGTQLWNHSDSAVTSNILSFEYYTFQTQEQTRLQTPKFKFCIYGKSSNSTSATMCSSELYRYNYNLKKVIMDKINSHIEGIKKDKSYTDGFVHKCYKNNIYTTILYNSLLDEPCIRFMIGDKEKSILDTDKIFIPLIEFTSLYVTLNKSFDNFCSMSTNVVFLDMFKKYSENIYDKIDSLRRDIDNIKIPQQSIVVSQPEEVNHDFDNVTLSESDKPMETEEEIENTPTEFDKFLEDNVDKMELDLGDKKDKTEKDIVFDNFLASNVFKKNFKNVESIILNCVNSGLPLNSFVNTVYSTSSFDLYNGISEIDKCSLNYVISRIIKINVNKYIQSKIELPKYTLPVIINEDVKNEEIIQKKIDSMYFLLLSYVYLNKVVNILSLKNENSMKNKRFLSYCIKTITSPFVFSYLPRIQKDVIKSTISRMYYDLKKEDFFKEYEDEIYNDYRVEIGLDSNYIDESIDKIYDNVIKLKDKISVENFFDLTKNLILKYKDFDGLKYTDDVIDKICKIESAYIRNNVENCLKTEVKSCDDVSQSILVKYGIVDKKFDNEIVVKYICDRYPNFKDIEQIKNINRNVYDVIDKIDIKNYPLDILKCLYFWNVDTIDKNIKYCDFCKIVDNSSLDKNNLISMILSKKYKVDDTFYNSLSLISKNE